MTSNAVPSFLDNPSSCLTAIATRPPSRDLWGMLSGTAASAVKDEENAHLCPLYLRAVAQQLPASEIAAENVASASNNSTMEFEVLRAQRLLEVLDASSVAATKCTPRLAITQTGILQALLVHPGFKSTSLTQVQVEFCQIAVLAEQYRFAARVLQGQWPRPAATLSVRHILRYFLLRGMIHVGCNDWTMAVRCFWTCLSVPSEVTSALAINAWKKMVLVQCLQMEDDDYRSAQEFQFQQKQASQPSVETMIIEGAFAGGATSSQTSPLAAAASGRGPLSLPKAVPNCVSRFLTMASNKQQQQQRSSQQQQPEETMGHMVQEELGEPSSQQQQQQRPQQPGSYAAMGVRVYMDLVYSFVAGDRTKFQSLVQQHLTLLQSDGNLGLVRQCETAMLHRQVYQMSRIFSVMPLTDLAAKLKMDSTDGLKELLHQLSLEKSFTCNKDAKWPSIEVEDDGMVVFNFETPSLPEEFSGMIEEEQPDNTLDDGIQELIKLSKEVEKLDVAIATSPMYHALVRRAQDAKMGGPRGVEDL